MPFSQSGAYETIRITENVQRALHILTKLEASVSEEGETLQFLKLEMRFV